MPLIASGASAAVIIPKGYALAIAAGSVGVLAFGPGPAGRQAPAAIVAQAQQLGPYPDVQTVYITTASGQVSYSLQRADGMVASLVPASPFKLSALILEQNHAAGTPLTGSTSLTVLASILVPAGLMGLNGSIRVSAGTTITNNANTKTLSFALGGAALLSVSTTAATGLQLTSIIGNRGALSSQISRAYGNNGAGSEVTSAINTGVDQILTINGQLGVGTDSMTLDSYVVEVLPG